MSARALGAWSTEPAASRTLGTNPRTPEASAVEIQFREDLGHEYRLEAINAGLSPAQANEYAIALSREMGPVAGMPEMAPGNRGWFYQSRARIVRQTFAAGLIKLMEPGKIEVTRRNTVAAASVLARRFRWWNAED
jgi:hypothetical protein